MKQLLDIESLTVQQIQDLLKLTKKLENSSNQQLRGLLADITVCLIFMESSTRTRCGFELAAKKLGAHVLNITPNVSSLKKAESFYDTVVTLQALGSDLFAIRHPENGSLATLAEQLPDLPLINAGDGSHAHPTQALLDLYTIQQQKPHLTNPKIAILGDVRYSRVFRSLMAIYQKMNFTDIRLLAPKLLYPEEVDSLDLTTFENFEEGLADVDVIVVLRLQKERMPEEISNQTNHFLAEYGLTTQRLAMANPDAMVMHPGPINRGVEIESAVADSPQSLILKQVHNGLFVRMATLLTLLGKA